MDIYALISLRGLLLTCGENFTSPAPLELYLLKRLGDVINTLLTKKREELKLLISQRMNGEAA